MDDSYEALMPKLWRRTKFSILQTLKDLKNRMKKARGQELKGLEADAADAEKALAGIEERLLKPVECSFQSGHFKKYSWVVEEMESQKALERRLEREEREREAEEEFQLARLEAVEAGEEPPPRKLRKGRRGMSALTILGEM